MRHRGRVAHHTPGARIHPNDDHATLPDPVPVAAGPRSRRAAPPREKKPGAVLWLTYAAWAMVLFDINFFLGGMIAGGFGRLATFVYVPLMVVALLRVPDILGRRRGWILFAPLALLLIVGVVTLPTANNPAMAIDALKLVLPYYALLVVTADYVRTPVQALPILAMFIWRFAWWAMWSGTRGLVPWHPTLANYDAYGGLMVQGAGICYWAGMAVRKRRPVRLALFALAGFCVLGVVASFARGAFLALVAVGFLIWLRSPRKVVTASAMVGGALVVALAASTLFDGSSFWDEIRSSFEEGADEGTGGQRMAMWTAAVRVWMQHPFLGVGPSNFGVFASTYFRQGEIPFFENPLMFYGFNLHNAYVQVLAEFGLVGMFAFIWMHVDFFRKNWALHARDAQAAWAATRAGRQFELRYLALALEAGMLAIMLANVLYASLFESWLFTAFAANRMLWSVTRPTKASPPRRKRAPGDTDAVSPDVISAAALLRGVVAPPQQSPSG